MKDKIKGFVKEHKKEIGLCTGIGVVYLTGYMNGGTIMKWKTNAGIYHLFSINPELEPMMWDAIKKAKELKGL